MRVVIVTRQFWPIAGGNERAIAHLAAALVARGAKVTVITTRWDQNWPERIDYRGVSVVRLHQTGMEFLGNRDWLRNMSRYLRENADQFDVAYVRGLRHDARSALNAVERRHVIVVARVDESGPAGDCLWQLESGDGRRIKRRVMKAAALIGTTEIAHRELIAAGYPRERVHCIVGGVPVSGPVSPAGKVAARVALANVNTLLHCPPETPVAVYTGKLDAPDIPGRVIDAWKSVAKRWPNARLWLIDPRADQSELNRRAEAADLVGRVVIPGVFADASELLAAADAAIVGGESGESHALLLEAMSAGLPVAAMDNPLHRCALEGEGCARLIPGMDSEVLGEFLVEMFCEDAEARRIGARAMALVKRKYEIGSVADAHMSLLEDLVKKKESSSSL